MLTPVEDCSEFCYAKLLTVTFQYSAHQCAVRSLSVTPKSPPLVAPVLLTGPRTEGKSMFVRIRPCILATRNTAVPEYKIRNSNYFAAGPLGLVLSF